MTVVYAKKFGDRILTLTDTMISDPSASTNNAIPGRLKSVVLGAKLSVSYTGPSLLSIDLIKKAKALHDHEVDLITIISYLQDSTTNHDGLPEFVLSSHMELPELVKISNGEVVRDLPECFVGEQFLKAEIDALSEGAAKTIEPPRRLN